MFRIGQFSKLTGVSTKTLIYYDNIGLLKPAKVDYENGYRYYDEGSLKRLADIHFFQSMNFSIKEIIKLSDKVIDEKINFLEDKINFYLLNINLLKNIKEKIMEKEKLTTIFGLANGIIRGKWSYNGSTSSFKKVINNLKGELNDNSVPQHLFFGQDNVGTDLNQVFGWDVESFSLIVDEKEDKKRNFWFFSIDYLQTLVVYEKNNSSLIFHIYSRDNFTEYTNEQIELLSKKYSSMQKPPKPFNRELVGHYKIYDEICESEIESYNGKIKTADACYTLSPLFDVIEIDKDQNVHIMEKDEELELSSKGKKKKIFNYSNTVVKIEMSGKDFYIDNTLTGKKHFGTIKKVNNQEFLFINLDNNVDIDTSIYVFKKEV